ncbi:MAG: hypothetical protein J6U85_08315 [Bacteroidales bacterium]|nr:hypothetical protein [Bacteroidales bacterium]
MKKILGIAVVLLTLGMMSCSPSPVGTWVEVTGGVEEQGFTLNKDGSASSLNMGYVVFDKWEKSGDLLILKGDYTGLVKREFSDTMKIEKLTKTDLTLSQGIYTVSYIKK